MKIRIEKEKLEKLLKAVKHVANSGRATLPILSHVVLKAHEGVVSLMASNIDQTLVVTESDCVELENGSTALSCKRLHELVKHEEGVITIQSKEKKRSIKIEGNDSNYTMEALDPSDMPEPADEKRNSVAIPAGQLKLMLERTCPAASTDGNRYVLNGVSLEIGSEELKSVATDGKRLACMVYPLETDKEYQVIIPTDAVKTLIKTLPEDDEIIVKVSIGKKSALLVWPGYQFHTLLIDGEYPNWRQVIPTFSKPAKVEMNARDITHAVAKAAVMTSEASSGLTFVLSKAGLVISSKTEAIGFAVIRATSGEGVSEEKRITMGVGYLMDALSVCGPDDEVSLEWEEELSPMLLKTSRFMTVIMPLRVD